MREIATIKFKDAESSDDAVVIVKSTGVAIALTLSVKKGGDAEAVMSKADVRKLLEALKDAIA